MLEALQQSLQNLRANKLRSFLTMFGILWGIVSIVVLSGMGEGFRRGNERVLREFGKNIVIIRSGRTSLQAGGERAGRRILLDLADARALAAQSKLLEVVSPEIIRDDLRVKSPYNAASVRVHGVEPQYQEIRTLDLEYGRSFTQRDEEEGNRVAVLGSDVIEQLFGHRHALGEPLMMNGLPYTVTGKIRRKDQDSNYSGPDNNKIFVPFAAMRRDFPVRGPALSRDSLSAIIATPKDSVVAEIVENPLEGAGSVFSMDGRVEREVRRILSRRHGFDPADREALSMWNTTMETALFDKIISSMKEFFLLVGLVTLALGGIGVMNIMLVAVRERTVEIGIRKALGATTREIQRQFFLEGFFLTALSGGVGLALGIGLCEAVNLLPLPPRFSGMIVTWETAFLSVVTLILIGVVTSTYPARKAAKLAPVEALYYER